jgi:hypothetical protein
MYFDFFGLVHGLYRRFSLFSSNNFSRDKHQPKKQMGEVEPRGKEVSLGNPAGPQPFAVEWVLLS